MKQKDNISTMTVHEFVDWIDKQFPPRCVKAKDTLVEIHRQGARRELIEHLINRLQREENASHPQISL